MQPFQTLTLQALTVLCVMAVPVLIGLAHAQDRIDRTQGLDLDVEAELETLRQPEERLGRELTVLAPTLPPEAIDRAVLNRLMQEIANDPDTAQQRLGVSEQQLDDIFITLTNARSFINNNEMAAIRAMCHAYNNSQLEGDERIEQALNAYKRRASYTNSFISRYYQRVLFNIESGLSEPASTLFSNYMNDRRRRMANAGNITFGSVVENVTSGTESVNFHCRRDN